MNQAGQEIRTDKPEWIKRKLRFRLDKEAAKWRKEEGVAVLPRKMFNALLRKHECAWLHKFRGMRMELGKIQFEEDGKQFEGAYEFWAKDWHVHMTKPFEKHLTRHMMYMIPTTYWSKDHYDVYAVMKNEMLLAYRIASNKDNG